MALKVLIGFQLSVALRFTLAARLLIWTDEFIGSTCRTGEKLSAVLTLLVVEIGKDELATQTWVGVWLLLVDWTGPRGSARAPVCAGRKGLVAGIETGFLLLHQRGPSPADHLVRRFQYWPCEYRLFRPLVRMQDAL